MSIPTKPINILLVDDDEVDVRAIQRGFAKEMINNPFYVASNGREALEMSRVAKEFVDQAKLLKRFMFTVEFPTDN